MIFRLKIFKIYINMIYYNLNIEEMNSKLGLRITEEYFFII